jgi:Helix-turn-helix domain
MEAYLKYFDLLELPPESGIEEIHKNYNYLKELYSGDSIEISALNSDFSEQLRQDYLSRLDDAHEKLNQLLENQKPAPTCKVVTMDDELQEWVEHITCFSGAALKSIRERMGVDLKDIFDATRIQPQYLEYIEGECFEFFRAEVYLRSYIIEYTRFLLLDTQRVLADYLPRYRSWAASRTN